MTLEKNGPKLYSRPRDAGGGGGHIKAKTLISNHAAVELQQIEQENHKVYVHQINEQCTVFVLDMIK